MKGTTGGIVDLYVDGSETPWGTVDLSSSTAQYKQKLFSITDTGAEPRGHAQAQPGKPGREVHQPGLRGGRPESHGVRAHAADDVPLLTYAGSWSTLSSSSYSGGSFAYTNTAGSSVRSPTIRS